MTAHYLRATKTVRCLTCGPGLPDHTPGPDADDATAPPASTAPPATVETTGAELVQDALPRRATCDDCARRLARGVDTLFALDGTVTLCLDCIALDTVHSVGVAGGGARRLHAQRRDGHHTRVRTAHPKLGGLILALREDPQHVRAWHSGAVGEEDFGRRLSAIASDDLKVLHDRKLPRSSANIDHLAVTSHTVWVIDAKRYGRPLGPVPWEQSRRRCAPIPAAPSSAVRRSRR